MGTMQGYAAGVHCGVEWGAICTMQSANRTCCTNNAVLLQEMHRLVKIAITATQNAVFWILFSMFSMLQFSVNYGKPGWVSRIRSHKKGIGCSSHAEHLFTWPAALATNCLRRKVCARLYKNIRTILCQSRNATNSKETHNEVVISPSR